MISLQISHAIQTSWERCSTASHCLALSYRRCIWRFIIGTFPKWPISIVMDAWFDCAKMALSLPSKLLSRASWWAVLILSPTFFRSPFFFSHPSDGNRCEPYPPKSPFHQLQTYSLIFSYLCTLQLLTIFPAYLLCVRVFTGASTHTRTTLRAYAFLHSPVQQSPHLSRAERNFSLFLSAWCCPTLLFRTLDAISCYLETQLSIISIVAGKAQSTVGSLLIFFLLVTLKWMETQKEQKLKNAFCVDVFERSRWDEN